MKSIFQIRYFRNGSNAFWITLSLLFVSIIVPTFCMVWLIGRAASNERLALEQALSNLREREGVLIAKQMADSASDLLDQLDSVSIQSEEAFALGWVWIPLGQEDRVSIGKTDITDLKDYLSDIHYLSQSFGYEVALDQIRTYLGDTALELLTFSDGSLLTPYLMLLGIEYGGMIKADTTDIETFLRESIVSNRKIPAFQRRFLIEESRRMKLEIPDISKLEKIEQLRYEWKSNYGAEGGKVFEQGEITFEKNHVFYSNDPNRGGWIISKREFEDELLQPLLNHLDYNIDSLQLVFPNEVVDSNPLFKVFDLDRPFKDVRGRVGFPELAQTGSIVDQRIFLYVWVGAGTIFVSLLLVFLSMGMVRRQITLAQLKNDLVATVSHELKTPIASIRILVETLLNESKSDPVKLKEYLVLIDNENRRLGLLVHKFLAFSKMEKSENYFEMEKVSPKEVGKEALQAFEERFDRKSYSLTLRCQDSYAQPLLGDRDALVTALGNLLENAYKYGGVGKEITFGCSQNESSTLFEVTDNGEGISKREQKRIFEQFYQPDRRLNKHKGGVGLGLSIVSLIVKKHRGKVEIDSEAGEGCCFRMIIPNA